MELKIIFDSVQGSQCGLLSSNSIKRTQKPEYNSYFWGTPCCHCCQSVRFRGDCQANECREEIWQLLLYCIISSGYNLMNLKKVS